jgi:hypothetical protein
MANICGIPFRIRRGTKAQLDNYGPLADGELGLAEDQCLIYAGCGNNNFIVGAVISGSVDPSTPRSPGLLFVNTSTSGIFFSTGVGWIPVGTHNLSDLQGNLDSIDDGIVYQRVRASELDDGYIIQLHDGSYIVTASGAYTHINNDDLHRVINDLGVSSIELWSSQKVNDSLTAAIHGLDPQSSVLDKDLCSPPVTISEGDRYIICPTASGAWSAYSNYITEYVDSAWEYIEPNKGFFAYVEDESRLYLYDGAVWGPLSSIVNHNILAGLQGGQSNEYYHLNTSQYTAITTNLNETIQDIIATTISGGSHIEVDYNDSLGVVTIALGSHSLIDPLVHTVTTVSGRVLAATSTNTIDMVPITLDMLPTISHSDLADVSSDQHHARLHSVLPESSDHSWGVLTDNRLLGVVTSASGVVWISEIDGGSF